MAYLTHATHPTDGTSSHATTPSLTANCTSSALVFNDPGLRELSPREREVLQLLAEGKSMKEVAAVLEISPRTVEFHKYRVMELLGVKSNAELVQYAIKHGLIAP